MSAILENLNAAITDHLVDIEEMFKGPVCVTLCVRNPAFPDGSRDVVTSNEADINDAVAAILRNIADPQVKVTRSKP